MKFIKRIAIGVLGLVTYIGCSDVGFDVQPSVTCEEFNQEHGPGSCELTPDGFNTYRYSILTGKVDILFVNDNSGSMYTEQSKMAQRFSSLVDALTFNGKTIDWRIAMVTTDISENKFLTFPNGKTFLQDESNYLQKFQDTIKRPETSVCDKSGYSDCPSGDERGIYAVNQALDRGHPDFFRPNAHLAVVILSDEDERSTGGEFSIGKFYPLEPYDLPETLVSKFQYQQGETKTMSVHSIIIPPGQSGCYDQQNQQSGVDGHYGDIYAQLSKANNALRSLGNIVEGHIGSICASDYGTHLKAIGKHITGHTKEIQLPCSPEPESVQIEFSPAPSQQIYFEVNADNRVIFTDGGGTKTSVSPGTEMDIEFKCDRTQ